MDYRDEIIEGIVRMLQKIKSEKILRCIHVFVSDILLEDV